jgi:uncharacterized repeat protein (TIGR03803 family)
LLATELLALALWSRGRPGRRIALREAAARERGLRDHLYVRLFRRSWPLATLINVDGTLYGTTTGGEPSGGGTVFKVSTGGTEKALHTFESAADGAVPIAGLIDVDGTLHGTTRAGGANGRGAVFSVSLAGVEHVLYGDFGGGGRGANPDGTLVEVNGKLYGTRHKAAQRSMASRPEAAPSSA